ncbi:hypothetical protein SH449x_001774 [Pirellulaceae bacterium SH449]
MIVIFRSINAVYSTFNLLASILCGMIAATLFDDGVAKAQQERPRSESFNQKDVDSILVPVDHKIDSSYASESITIGGFSMRRFFPPFDFVLAEKNDQRIPLSGFMSWSGDGNLFFFGHNRTIACFSYPEMTVNRMIEFQSGMKAIRIASEEAIFFSLKARIQTDFSFQANQSNQGISAADLYSIVSTTEHPGYFQLSRAATIQKLQHFTNLNEPPTKIADLDVGLFSSFSMSTHGGLLHVEDKESHHFFRLKPGLERLGKLDKPTNDSDHSWRESVFLNESGKLIVMLKWNEKKKTSGTKLTVVSPNSGLSVMSELDLNCPAIAAAYSPLHKSIFVSANDGSFWRIVPNKEPSQILLEPFELPGTPFPILHMAVNPVHRCVACVGKDRVIFIE